MFNIRPCAAFASTLITHKHSQKENNFIPGITFRYPSHQAVVFVRLHRIVVPRGACLSVTKERELWCPKPLVRAKNVYRDTTWSTKRLKTPPHRSVAPDSPYFHSQSETPKSANATYKTTF